MNAVERFFRVFARLAKPNRWEVRPNGYIRHKKGWCPLAFVASRRSHHDVGYSDYTTPGLRMGMACDESRQIASAADGVMTNYPTYRARLLKAIGV